MSLLAIQLPPRRRLGPRAPAAGAEAAAALAVQWAHVFSANGHTAGPLRQAPAADLPKAQQVVLVVAAADVSWHRLRVPKAKPAHMRRALLGMLEDHLLEEVETVHLALAADASPGQTGWVAAAHGPHLKAALAALEAAGVQVARVTSALPAPPAVLRAHFSCAEDDPAGWAEAAAAAAVQPPAAADDHGMHWTLSTADGAWHLPLRPTSGNTAGAPPPYTRTAAERHGSLGGDLAQALLRGLPAATAEQRWTCTPAAAAAAAAFLGRPVPVITPAAYVLEAALAATNLRQFELQPRHRGLARLREFKQQLGRREWRSARQGLWALAATQLLGLNAAAWQEQQALQARRSGLDALLRSSFPDQRVVLDAPAQMRSATQRLRAAAGEPGPGDVETALAAAAAAWPAGLPPVSAIRYEGARLTLASAGWPEPAVAALRQQLAASGFLVAYSDNLLTLQPGGDNARQASAPAAPPPPAPSPP